MTTTKELIVQQEDTANLIRKAQINYKKCPRARLTLGYLKVRMQCIDEYWITFKTTHALLLKITKKDNRESLPYFVNELYDSCENQYLELKTDMQDLVHELSAVDVANNTSSSSDPNAYVQGGVNNSMDIKLPRMELPKFSGNYEDWQTFEDTFKSVIHNNNLLSNVQKLHYLKSCLSGEASTTLKHYQVTEANYEPAWNTLKQRYSNKRLIVNTILKKLFIQRKIQAQSPSQLKQFIDLTRECVSGLQNLGIALISWDPILIYISMQKLDLETHREWEDHVSASAVHSDDLPSFKELMKFLDGRIHTLELTMSNSKSIKERTYFASNSDKPCLCCNKENHTLSHCKEFAKLNPRDRSEYVKINRLCYNCLLPGHSVKVCRLKFSCKLCGRRHHSMLHEKDKQETVDEDNTDASGIALHTNFDDENDDDVLSQKNHNEVLINSHFVNKRSTALLATALVPVKGTSGQIIILRALIDQGSQASFISERATQLLKLKKTQINGTVTGVGSTSTRICHVVQFEILSRLEAKFSFKVKAYVLATKLTTQLPIKPIPYTDWPHLRTLSLADTSFHEPGKIDMLLGVDVYAHIIKNELIKGPPGSPIAQRTSLGWILFGNVDISTEREEYISLHCLDVNMDNLLKRLWELDDCKIRELTKDERLCEEIYNTTHSRTKEGRYIVKLPMKCKQPLATQGETKDIAMKRLLQLERRFVRNIDLKRDYVNVMNEYINLNHMEEVPLEEIMNPAVYLPHHAVIREEKDTTKTRIVFDASCKGTNMKSLNDDLLVGPTLQEDLRNLIIRWRMKSVCFVADIEKMYREVLVTKEDRDYQRILWRSNFQDDVKHYRMTRVTFGTASAPYLAVRTLMQIAEDEGKEYPAEALTIKQDFYVDDLISGRDTINEAVHAAVTITKLLQKGGFNLKKWSSNSKSFLSQLKPHQINSETNIDIKTDGIIKTLGLTWDRIKDVLKYQISLFNLPEIITKRRILAEIQRLFDPLGFLAPALVPAKMIMQKLWLQGVTWDEEIDSETKEEWSKLRGSLTFIEKIEIKRWLHTCQKTLKNTTVHGFCDASTKAYAAVAYMRVISANGQIKTGIIAAKCRVAPVKPVSLPRLELCGAVLLSRLLKQIQEATKINNDQIFAWTDSEIVLSWLFGDPARWNTFVSNRVVEIIDNIGNQRWYHVSSEDNPADIASRGQPIPELISNVLWWKGPEWLQANGIIYARPKTKYTEEIKKSLQSNLKIENETRLLSFENFASFQELLRVVTYARRFLNFKRDTKTHKPFTTMELDETLKKLIRMTQEKDYKTEITRLQQNKLVHKISNLRSLNPYLDDDNILRVGGRLRHADIPETSKHPIILGHQNKLVPLLIANAHDKTLHGGLQLTMNCLRSNYWIIKIKSLVKRHIHHCITCAKQRATQKQMIMGDLPKVRVTPSRPFINSGVDFAGPLQILMSRGRGAKCHKAYISIFVCMSTKAIHLELVGDLTAKAFLGAFRRFIARRGRCNHIWSDHGTNFVAANKELCKLWQEAELEIPDTVADVLINEGTQWHFIPPYSPNFGGLWEAGVKSVKYHLKRILNTNLTFEEMSTVLCQIEACLNSRPLCPIDTSNTDSINILTPGHFLIGEAPVNVSEPNLSNIKIDRLTRWQLTQRLVQHFWRRWQTEYLVRLQNRPKWQRLGSEFQIGDIVIIKEDNLPPTKWALGRIVEKHPGHDNICRVYSVKCRGKIITRSVNKLCELPVNQ